MDNLWKYLLMTSWFLPLYYHHEGQGRIVYLHILKDSTDIRQTTHILFDCDNTLVLSEALAFEACAELSNEILASHNVADRYTGTLIIHLLV